MARLTVEEMAEVMEIRGEGWRYERAFLLKGAKALQARIRAEVCSEHAAAMRKECWCNLECVRVFGEHLPGCPALWAEKFEAQAEQEGV